jgi:phage gpG-like protein
MSMNGYGMLALNLRKLITVPSQASKLVSLEIRDLIEEQFNQGKDPYGNKWKPLKRKGQPPSHLTEDTPLRRSVEVKPASGAGLTITVTESYATFHQIGTKHMVARPILPNNTTLPAAWTAAIKASIEIAIEATRK